MQFTVTVIGKTVSSETLHSKFFNLCLRYTFCPSIFQCCHHTVCLIELYVFFSFGVNLLILVVRNWASQKMGHACLSAAVGVNKSGIFGFFSTFPRSHRTKKWIASFSIFVILFRLFLLHEMKMTLSKILPINLFYFSRLLLPINSTFSHIKIFTLPQK